MAQKAYIKTASGLVAIAEPKIKTFESAAKVQAAINNGTLREGDEFQTHVTEGIKEDIVQAVYDIQAVIPPDASKTNLLVTQADIAALDVSSIDNRLTTVEGYIPANTTSANPLVNNNGLTQSYNALDLAKVNVTDFNTYKSNVTSALSNKVDCSYVTDSLVPRLEDIEADNEAQQTQLTSLRNNKVDQTAYDTRQTAINTALSNKVDCTYVTGDLENRLTTIEDDVSDNTTAIGTKVTCSDFSTYVATTKLEIDDKVDCSDFSTLSTTVTDNKTAADTALSNKVSCSDFTTYQTTVTTALSGKVDSTTYNTAMANKASCTDLSSVDGRVTDLESCAGLACTGTVIPSDLTPITSRLSTAESDIVDLESCAGLACVGTVKTINGVGPDSTGNISITLPSSYTFTLSGNTLTITEA